MMRSTHQAGAFAAALAIVTVAQPFLVGDQPQVGLPPLALSFLEPLGLPTGRSHLPLPAASVYVLSALAGALTPDLDKPRRLWARFLASGVFGGHRHLSHSLLGATLAAGLLYALFALLLPTLGFAAGLLWLGFVVGFLSHLLLDGLTVEGVPWLFPWRRERVGLLPWRGLRVRTGSVVEQYLVVPLLLLAIAWLGIDRGEALRARGGSRAGGRPLCCLLDGQT